MSAVVEEILALYERHGGQTYGEDVTQSEHALQCAALAERESAPPALVAAALLHDVGHLIHVADDAYGHHGHARTGGDYLSERFGPEVSEPVRLHVSAKRYLCAKQPCYFEKLSAASVHSLAKQGGPMSREEMEAFEAEPYKADAVRLRQWDEHGKEEGLALPDFMHYRALLESLVRIGQVSANNR